MVLVSLPLPARKQEPWLVVPLSLLLLLGVGCLIVLLPCAFGMVALNLARVLVARGTYTEFLSSRYDWVVTNKDCDVDAVHGWLVHVQETLWSLVHPCCACLYELPSDLLVLPTCTPFGVALPSWASPLGLAWLVWVFAPLVSFCGVGRSFAGLFAPLVWSGRLGLPMPWSRLFPLGLCSRCWWRAFVVGCCCCCCCCCCCGCPLALRCLLGGSSDQSSHLLHVCQGLLPQCHRQRRTRSWDHGAVDGERTGTHSPSVCWSVPSNGQGWLDQFFINSLWDLSDLPNAICAILNLLIYQFDPILKFSRAILPTANTQQIMFAFVFSPVYL